MRRAALLAALVLAGCGSAAPTVDRRAPGDPVLQAANGPVAPGPGPLPLAVKLADRSDPVRVPFHHPPRSGLLFDLDTGRVLWRRNPERVLPIASLTKMMTALVVVAHAGPDVHVRITAKALRYQGSGVGVLPRRKAVRLETLLNGLLLPSGNDAARALAEHVGGTLKGFIALMNERAGRMGLRCTHYTSVDGFLDAGNHSCTVDLAAEARAMLDQPRLARIVRRRRAILPLAIKGGRVYLYNNNPLILRRYPGVIGIKTGYTDAAGHCLVAAATRHGHRLGVVLLHSPDTGDQARKLLDRGFRILSG
jgi:D-alanyl-D-alanine carboxypeptidase